MQVSCLQHSEVPEAFCVLQTVAPHVQFPHGQGHEGFIHGLDLAVTKVHDLQTFQRCQGIDILYLGIGAVNVSQILRLTKVGNILYAGVVELDIPQVFHRHPGQIRKGYVLRKIQKAQLAHALKGDILIANTTVDQLQCADFRALGQEVETADDGAVLHGKGLQLRQAQVIQGTVLNSTVGKIEEFQFLQPIELLCRLGRYGFLPQGKAVFMTAHTHIRQDFDRQIIPHHDHNRCDDQSCCQNNGGNDHG